MIGVASRVVGGITTAQLAAPAAVNSHLYHVRRFFYDTAGSTNPVLMQGIARLAGELPGTSSRAPLHARTCLCLIIR